jgi:flagellar assembly protein FliH
MLSKVLTGRHREKATAASFPNLGPEHPVVNEVHGVEPGAGETVDTSALREQIRQLAARHVNEKREALEVGNQQGEQKARGELQPVLERLHAAINDITALRPEIRRRAERDTIQLALLIAKRILHRELSVDENALNGIARIAFERLTRSESYTVRVHPRFAPAITAALPAVQSSRVIIEPDPSCAPGTLVIRSSEGVIDASIDTQLEEISRGLTDRLLHS